MGKAPSNRRKGQQRVAKMLQAATKKAAHGSWAGSAFICQKRYGEAVKAGIKTVEVRAWSERKLRGRLSKDQAPSVGRMHWSHEGCNSLSFMYPHVSESNCWGVAENFADLEKALKSRRLYTACFNPASTVDGTARDLVADEREFLQFVKQKLGTKTPLVWFKIRVLDFGS